MILCPARCVLLLAAPIALAAGTLLTGCARNSEVQAGEDLVRLATLDDGLVNPIYSPDGKTIVYSSRPDMGKNAYYVFRIAASGGSPQVLYTDSTRVYAVDWLGSEELLVYTFDDYRLKRLSLEGQIVGEVPVDNVTEIMDVHESGEQVLVCTFTGDNCDVGIRPLEGGDIRYLAETPQWELTVSFGPGEDEVTLVRQETYTAATSEILVWSPETEAFRTLPLQNANLMSPTWAPDGSLLAYCTDVAGNFDVWLLEAKGERLVQLTSGPEDDSDPSWSPDGQSVAFVRSSVSSNVYVADSKTHAKTQLTHGDTPDVWPKVSPDGKWVVFARVAKSKEGGRELDLCVVSTQGGDVRKLDIEDLRLAAADRQEFDWSPDGSEIAFAADDGSGNVGIYRIPLEGGSPVQVTITPGLEMLPAWSPDGATIAYMRISGETQIWTIPATGGLAKQVSLNEGINVRPVWAKDSNWIAYLSNRPDEGLEVWTAPMSEPGSGKRVVESKTLVIPVGWSDSGGEILLLREEETNHISVIRTDGEGERVIATQDPELNAGHGFQFTREGENYRAAYYCGAFYAFTDGKQVSDLYQLRVAGWTGSPSGKGAK